MSYLPYLRGKQYELLALREYINNDLPFQSIIPLIEPVKLPTRSLATCVETLNSNKLDHIIIANPGVGDLTSPDEIHPELEHFYTDDTVGDSSSTMLGLIITESTNIDTLIDSVSQNGAHSKIVLIHKKRNAQSEQVESSTRSRREFDVIDSQLRRRGYAENLRHAQGITLQDGFDQAPRNADYLKRGVSIFSEEHLYYREENWAGFSDFLTIGESYQEGGFTPRAVAIHWTFVDRDNGPILIRHFTSDSNLDPANVAGKFLEAVRKLVVFLDEMNIHNYASEVFRGHLRDKTYPGLGTVKKLSIINHLEVVAGVLE